MKRQIKMACFGAVLIVIIAWIASIFLQYGFIHVADPHSTWILRIERGTIWLSFHDSPVWLKPAIYANLSHQRFHWWEFYYTISPIDKSFEMDFSAWVLGLPFLLLLSVQYHFTRKSNVPVADYLK
jgi:hypothetical protein